jgi:hypothetical protein
MYLSRLLSCSTDIDFGDCSNATSPRCNPGPGASPHWEKNNGTSTFALKYGNADSGGLTTAYSGALPSGYAPMHVENSILLGVGGDNSNGGDGAFFEGATTSGYPTDATENAVQANITSPRAPGVNREPAQAVRCVRPPTGRSAPRGMRSAGLALGSVRPATK